jgi:hypothetical protein
MATLAATFIQFLKAMSLLRASFSRLVGAHSGTHVGSDMVKVQRPAV